MPDDADGINRRYYYCEIGKIDIAEWQIQGWCRAVIPPRPSDAPVGMLLLKRPPFSLLLKGSPIANMVDALEGWDAFLVMGHDDDGGLVLSGHLVEDTHHRQRPFAVQWG